MLKIKITATCIDSKNDIYAYITNQVITLILSLLLIFSAVLVSYVNIETGEVVLEHLDSYEVIKVDAKSLVHGLVQIFKKHNLDWDNVVSILMDSCNVMRGKLGGVETRIRKDLAPHLLDVDGDSCHHVHNSSKRFSKPFNNYLETLYSDLHTDEQWSPDQRCHLQEICDLLAVPFTVPARFVNHRWLSAYEISISSMRMFPAYLVLYYGFMSREDRSLYKEPLDAVYATHKVSQKARNKIAAIHEELRKKSMTPAGKQRKERIFQKIWHTEQATKLRMNFYIGILAQLTEYVKVFQGKETLVHKLHDQQLQVCVNFLACFIKPECLGVDIAAAKLVKLDVNNPAIHIKQKDRWYGEANKKLMKDTPNDIVKAFMQVAAEAFVACAEHMLKTLPLNSEELQALSCIDPVIRAHTVGTKGLTTLSKLLAHFLPKDCSILTEIKDYAVDRSLGTSGKNIAEWWSNVSSTGKYPGLSKIAAAALSCFHGPMVESSFNIMGDIIGSKSANLSTEVYSAYQSIKYNLRSKKVGAITLFKRDDIKHAPIDKSMCRNIRMAASRYKKTKAKKAEDRKKNLHTYGCKPTSSASNAREIIVNREKEAKRKREQSLQQLVEKRRKKQKS